MLRNGELQMYKLMQEGQTHIIRCLSTASTAYINIQQLNNSFLAKNYQH